jgi:peptidoglycan/LPS O-acetylase OafA/YrhL
VVRFFSSKPFVVLGEASFAFYILEVPVQTAYMRIFLPGKPNRGFDTSAGHFFRFTGLLLACSIASVYLFEKPVRRLLMRLTPEPTPRKAVASPASTATENDAVRAGDPDRAAPRSPDGVEVEPEGADVVVG